MSNADQFTSSKFEIPDLANATPGYLSDELGETRKVIKNANKLEGFLKEALKARKDEGAEYVDGEKWRTNFIESSRSGISGPLVKEIFDGWETIQLSADGGRDIKDMTVEEFFEDVTTRSSFTTIKSERCD